MNLQSAITLFIDAHENPVTAAAYRQTLIPMRDYLGPARPITEVTTPDLLRWVQTYHTRGLAPASINKHVKAIKAFFNWCVRIDLLSKSPAKEVKTKRPPRRISREKAMTDDELSALLDYLRYKPRDYALVLFLADTGCRAGGAALLRVEDLDLPNGRAFVTEKGDKTRPVSYGHDCRLAIEFWLRKRPKGAGAYVFSRTKTPVKPDNISQIIRRACQVVGIRSLGSHSLRHRKGHQLADNRVAASVAATALGHSDPSITLGYYYPDDWETAEKELRKLTVARSKPGNVVDIKQAGAG